MEFIKNNKKIIAAFAAGGIIFSSITGFAVKQYLASDIQYTKSGEASSISVSDALNELYANKKNTSDEVKLITTSGLHDLDKYYKKINVDMPIPEVGEGIVIENFKINGDHNNNALYYDIGFEPSMIFMYFGNNFYWAIKGDTNEYWCNGTDSSGTTSGFNTSNTGFYWYSYHDRTVTLYAIK